jgi:hypothetical protein
MSFQRIHWIGDAFFDTDANYDFISSFGDTYTISTNEQRHRTIIKSLNDNLEKKMWVALNMADNSVIASQHKKSKGTFFNGVKTTNWVCQNPKEASSPRPPDVESDSSECQDVSPANEKRSSQFHALTKKANDKAQNKRTNPLNSTIKNNLPNLRAESK